MNYQSRTNRSISYDVSATPWYSPAMPKGKKRFATKEAHHTVTPTEKALSVVHRLVAARLDGREIELSIKEQKILAAYEVPIEDITRITLKQKKKRAQKERARVLHRRRPLADIQF